MSSPGSEPRDPQEAALAQVLSKALRKHGWQGTEDDATSVQTVARMLIEKGWHQHPATADSVKTSYGSSRLYTARLSHLYTDPMLPWSWRHPVWAFRLWKSRWSRHRTGRSIIEVDRSPLESVPRKEG